MLLAESSVIYNERQEQRAAAAENLEKPPDIPTRSPLHIKIMKPIFWLALVLCCYIGSYPSRDAANTPGYGWLADMWDDPDYNWKHRFWLSMGGILIVSPASFLPTAQRFFTTRVARYLGKVSFGLYLVHGFMNRTFRLFL